jgi:hypothetical protein
VVEVLRALIRDAAPDAQESMTSAQPVYASNGPFAHLEVFAGHVELGFWRGAMLEAPAGVLQGEGESHRHLVLTSLDELRVDLVRALVRQAVLLNRRFGDPTRGLPA